MRTALMILGGLAAIIVLVAVVGAMLPKTHKASRSATLGASPADVFAMITSVEEFPNWRRDVQRVERLPDRDGRPAWVEFSRHGRMPLQTIESIAPRRLVLRIADPDLPFGGTWTYEIAGDPGGAVLTITEDGEIYNPFFRFMARFVFGYEQTLETYLTALQARVGGRRVGQE